MPFLCVTSIHACHLRYDGVRFGHEITSEMKETSRRREHLPTQDAWVDIGYSGWKYEPFENPFISTSQWRRCGDSHSSYARRPRLFWHDIAVVENAMTMSLHSTHPE